MEFRVLDLFSGAGGLSLGLDMNESIKTAVAVDLFNNALKTLRRNLPDVETICGDITNKEIKNRIVEISKSKQVNMIVGGPPCQGFSNKGKKLGLSDPRNFLFLEYIELVAKIKPEALIIENVKTLTTAANGYFINEIKDKLDSLGYIVNYKVLKASDYGVPQTRERTIIVATKTMPFNFDLIKKSDTSVTVRDAISDLSYLDSGQGGEISEYKNKSNSIFQEKMRNHDSVLYNHKATNHSQIAIDKLKMIPAEKGKEFLPAEYLGKQKFKTTWSRLEWDKPSPTIDTRFDTPSNGKNSHPVLNRAITPREAARLQSFPDSFQFIGGKTDICKQIGNAVPPLMAKAIGDSIINQYKEQSMRKQETGDNFKIYCDDSYKIIREFVRLDMKVDHIITDPPYNISTENNFSTMKNPRTGVDFGEWDKKFDLCGWISDYSRILSKNGSMIIFCSYRYMSEIVRALEKSSLIVKDILEWKKTNPMPRNTNRRYVQDTEFAIWAVMKGSKWIFNKPDDKPYLRSQFIAPIVGGRERTIHPTQKSLSVMNDIIKIHTNPGDKILDPFMGSGTTGVAALNSCRDFIGVEIDEKYYNISSNRIKETVAKLSKNQTTSSKYNTNNTRLSSQYC